VAAAASSRDGEARAFIRRLLEMIVRVASRFEMLIPRRLHFPMRVATLSKRLLCKFVSLSAASRPFERLRLPKRQCRSIGRSTTLFPLKRTVASSLFGFLPSPIEFRDREHETRPGESVTILRGVFEQLAIKIERHQNRKTDISGGRTSIGRTRTGYLLAQASD